MDQVSIFDIMEVEFPDFRTLEEAEVVDIIGRSIGVSFDKVDLGRFIEYRAEYKNSVIDVHVSHYTCYDREGESFISCSFWNKKQMSGAGVPCDSLDEAIEFFKKYR